MTEMQQVSTFDRAMGALVGIPNVIHTAPSTVRGTTPLVGNAQTFIIQTFRQRDDDGSAGDWLFIEYVEGRRAVRIAIPPQVTRVIARQRDALTDRSRSRAASTVAAERKAAGILPGFMQKKGGVKSAKKK